MTIVTVASIATLFHISTPLRTPWLRDVPGAALTLALWSLASFVLRGTIQASLDSTSIYGPLSAPIVLLIWLYFLAIAILIGAALNAAIRALWPVEERPSARARAVGWVKSELARRRAEDDGVAAGGAGAAGGGVGAAAGGVGATGAAGEPGAVGEGAPEPVGAPTGAGAPGAAASGGAEEDGEEPGAGRRKRSRPLTPLPEDPQRAARKAARKAARTTS